MAIRTDMGATQCFRIPTAANHVRAVTDFGLSTARSYCVERCITLTPQEYRCLAAIFDCIFPEDQHGPGATAIGAVEYLDRALGGWLSDKLPLYRLGLAALDAALLARHNEHFSDLPGADQIRILTALEQGTLPGLDGVDQVGFFAMMLGHCQEGCFADPLHGGNRDKQGWQIMGHPGVHLSNTAEENLATEPVDKGGRIQSLADVRNELSAATTTDPVYPGFDPRRSIEPPARRADVVLIGVGAAGALLAPILARAGMRVVGLEAGPLRSLQEYVPDELGATYYCRQNLGPKFMSEEPRWRRNKDEPTEDPTYSLGRMMNNAGGSVIHYGAWLRRFHPNNFRMRSHITERWGEQVIPEGCTVADWPISYDDLEPYFTRLDWEIGIAGDDRNPFLRRSKAYPLPPTRPFRLGNLFSDATERLGYHPHAVPVGYYTEPYNGYPAASYSAWDNGFGTWTGSKWNPTLTWIPEALATGNFDLRTSCRVVKILTDADGRAIGVAYVDGTGAVHTQLAETVVVCSYTWENVRLMFLSADAKHPDGLGNNTGQLGKHLMIKMFAHVGGYFPDQVFNRHTGPAAQGVVLDDFLEDGFDSWAAGEFLGGITLGAENQFLPLQIARESRPDGVPAWGADYREWIRGWQHFGVVRAQPEALSYTSNYVDIDPHRRDKSGLGMPVVRVTYDLQENERRIAEFFHRTAATILTEMGAEQTWNGPDFTGIGSSHDLGGTRMSDDPSAGVVDRDLAVHDTPGLYVFGGSAMPTCPGINPTLSLWAMVYRAADELVRAHGGIPQ